MTWMPTGRPSARPADRGSDGRKSRHRRVGDPERLAVVATRSFWRLDRALVERPLIMGKGGGEVDRAHEHVGVVEAAGPCGTQCHPLALPRDDLGPGCRRRVRLLEREE